MGTNKYIVQNEQGGSMNDLIVSKSISKMFCTFITDLIVMKLELCDSLNVKTQIVSSSEQGGSMNDLIVSKSISKMFYSFSTDVIRVEVDLCDSLNVKRQIDIST
jgi:hypothetical protein